MAQQTVIIDFQADYSSLQDGVTVLEQMGKVDAGLAAQFKKTNTEIKAQGAAFDKASASAGKEQQTLGKLQQLMAQFPKTGLNRFLLQIGNELTASGVKAEEFKKKLDPKDAVTKMTSLRKELRTVREEMQQAALAGGMLGEEYLRLKKRAGELDDTIKDVNNDIANSGSDTRGIDNVVGSISALTGAYSAAQGIQAIFGAESEDLQRALLKVNAAMAVATGFQQVSNALTKQGSLTRIADVAATYGQIAAQKIYTFVTGQSTKATLGFKVALAATGIGAVVLLVLTFITALKSQNDVLENTNKLLEDQKKAYDDLSTAIDISTRRRIADAEEEGRSQAEVARITEVGLIRRKAALQENNRLLTIQRDQLKIAVAEMKSFGINTSDATESLNNLNTAITENNAALAEIDTQQYEVASRERLRATEEANKAAEDAAAKAKERREKELEAARKARAAGFADFKAGIELQLLEAEKGSQRELEIRKSLIRAQLQIDLEAEGLTLNQRRLLIQKFFKDRIELDKQFNTATIALAAQAEKDRLSATLANLNLAEAERLQVRIEFLQIAASMEIAAAEGNAEKIRLINAELNAAIAAAKIESIRKTAEEENRLTAATGGAGRRALEGVAANEQMKADIRINAIRQLQAIEIAAIDRTIAANIAASQVIGADQRALQIEYEELMDAKAKATEDAEAKITGIVVNETKKRLDADMVYVQAALQGLQQIGTIMSQIQANEQQAAANAIDSQRRRVDELLEAGAITEKEAERRNKKIDAEERAAKNRAAQAQKRLAVFNAFLAIPQAYLAGLQTPVIGTIMGPIFAGIAAIQAGLVAAMPVPKFATGKKGSYKGLGKVGETGAELIQRADGRMEVATKETLVYLGSRDKVFTASETKNMMPFVNKEAIRHTGGDNIDYNKLSQAIMKGYRPGKSPVVNVDNSEVGEALGQALAKNDYFNRYYSSK